MIRQWPQLVRVWKILSLTQTLMCLALIRTDHISTLKESSGVLKPIELLFKVNDYGYMHSEFRIRSEAFSE